MCPVRKEDQDSRAAKDVGVTVKSDIKVFLLAGIFDKAKQPTGSSRAGSRLVKMCDVDWDPTPSTDIDRFPKWVKVTITEAVTHVCVVHPT